jgi:hypothetical protein
MTCVQTQTVVNPFPADTMAGYDPQKHPRTSKAPARYILFLLLALLFLFAPIPHVVRKIVFPFSQRNYQRHFRLSLDPTASCFKRRWISTTAYPKAPSCPARPQSCDLPTRDRIPSEGPGEMYGLHFAVSIPGYHQQSPLGRTRYFSHEQLSGTFPVYIRRVQRVFRPGCVSSQLHVVPHPYTPHGSRC